MLLAPLECALQAPVISLSSHTPGDYVILVSTGMKWYIALLLNFLSALTAVAGFFVGVAIGTDSEEAQNWVLAFTAGQFLYIALVDLVCATIILTECIHYCLCALPGTYTSTAKQPL